MRSYAVVLCASLLAACRGAATPVAPAPIQNLPGAEPAAPEPAACADPVAGVWTALVWREDAGKWDEVTFELERVGFTELRGQIAVRTWDGDEADDAPPICPDGSPAVSRVVQGASGTLRGADLDLQGRDPERTALACGIETSSVYHPDHFTGRLEPGPELVTVNDDGSVDHGRPHVFTRRACAANAHR